MRDINFVKAFKPKTKTDFDEMTLSDLIKYQDTIRVWMSEAIDQEDLYKWGKSLQEFISTREEMSNKNRRF